MADLSPAAQAVVTALEKFDWESGYFTREDIWALSKETAAAALRAVVEHLSETHAGFDLADRYGRFVEADDILAIAAEPEGPTPQPIPVSERWPEFSDCDNAERVWCWSWAIGTWRLSRINQSIHSHWLPAHALPLPEVEA